MTLLSTDTYEETQYQSPQPIWPQESLPLGVHNIEFSWDRFCRHDGGYMRIIFRDLTDDPGAKVKHPYHGFIRYNGAPLPYAAIDALQIPEGQYEVIGGWAHPYTFWLKEYLGKAQVTGTDNEEGRITLRAMARLDGETLTMYRPPDAKPHPLVQGLERKRTHNRLCYRRSSQDWRLRDERLPWNDSDALKFVTTYVGDLSAEWNGSDQIAHIYHNGSAVIDDQHICHLYDPDLSYG